MKTLTILVLALLLCSTAAGAALCETESPLTIAVAKQGGLSRDAARAQIELVTSAIKSELLAGREITLKNFGRFYVQELGARQVRNPRTGKPITVEARRYPKFTSSDNFKLLFNPKPARNPVEQQTTEAPQSKQESGIPG